MTFQKIFSKSENPFLTSKEFDKSFLYPSALTNANDNFYSLAEIVKDSRKSDYRHL